MCGCPDASATAGPKQSKSLLQCASIPRIREAMRRKSKQTKGAHIKQQQVTWSNEMERVSPMGWHEIEWSVILSEDMISKLSPEWPEKASQPYYEHLWGKKFYEKREIQNTCFCPTSNALKKKKNNPENRTTKIVQINKSLQNKQQCNLTQVKKKNIAASRFTLHAFA